MSSLARELQSRGHRVSIAGQRIDIFTSRQGGAAELWQAPVSPRLLTNAAQQSAIAAASHGDILAKVGLDDPAIVRAIIGAWDRLLGALSPDLIIAEYAPFLLLAARDRLPAVAVGTGFELPPVHLPHFPVLTGRACAIDESATRDSLNEALGALGRPGLDALPQIYAAQARVVATFAEIDPYADSRTEALAPPHIPSPMPAPPAALGDEVFVYGPSQISADAPLWQGLAASRLPVRVFVPDVPASYRAKLSGMGLRAESAPLPFSQIARRSRLLVSYSSHGFVCSGLVCGIPQVVCPVDLEKALVAQAVVKLGVAGVAAPGQIRPAAFGSSLRDLYHDASLAAAARNAAPRFRERVTRSDTELVVREIDRLL
jgi:hypothetical protein